MDKKKLEREITYLEDEARHETIMLHRKARKGGKKTFRGLLCLLVVIIAAAACIGSYYLPNVFLSEKSAYIHVREQMTAADIAGTGPYHESALVPPHGHTDRTGR